jgi:hypothetical protein
MLAPTRDPVLKRPLLPCFVVLVSLGVGVGGGAASAADERERDGWMVVGVGNESDVAGVTWPLAQAVYASPRLRPAHLREDEARALAGEAPKDPSPRLRDLYETRTALRGEDATSARLLASLAQTLNVRGFITVRVTTNRLPAAAPSGDGKPVENDAGSDGAATSQATSASEPKTTMTATARIFLAETQTFDAATYAPEGGLETPSWGRATASIERAFGRVPKVAAASSTVPAGSAGPSASKGSPFYKSFWFWGAMGAAALLGGTAFLLTRDTDPTSVHLRAEVPR